MNTPDRGHQKLQAADVLTIKIGGDNSPDLEENYQLISKRKTAGKKQLIAISAFKWKGFKTTDHLLEMGALIENGQAAWENKLDQILEVHKSVFQERVDAELIPEMEVCATSEFEKFKAQIKALIQKPKDEWQISKLGEDLLLCSQGKQLSLTGFGEKVVEKIYHRYFELKGQKTANLGEDEWMEEVLGEDAEKANRLKKSTIQKMRRGFKSRLKNALLEESATVITGGYKPGVAFRRSYTDLTAAEMARAASELGYKTVVGIEKQDPILTADPRIVDRSRVKVVQEMPWKIAAELFGIRGAQAGAIHPDVMETLAGTGVDIVVYDPNHEDKPSTWISEDCTTDPPVVVATKSIPSTVIVRGTMSNIPRVVASITRGLQDYILDQNYAGQNVWVGTFNDAIPTEVIDQLQRQLKARFGKDFSVEKKGDYALVLAIGKNGVTDYKTTLTEKGIVVPFNTGMLETETSSYVVDSTRAKESVNAIHYVTHEEPHAA